MVSRQTVTLANSIVGVSVLAMPFCFKQCGIVLATLMLMLGAVITRMVCYFLLKAGLITRRRTYEMLAWDTFGQGGKFIVEISIIGFLVGTLIAFFVVMGDLGPEILTEIFDIDNDKSLRIVIMAALGLFVALPLGLLRNIDSLSIVSTASVLFYVFLVFKILSEGIGPLFTGSYLDRIDYWRPAGVLQCIPIFSMALSCQTQIFGIYESLPEPTLQKMNEIVKQAVNICTVFYFCVGFFGYIAFCHQSFGGNILMSFSASWSTQLIKTCFLMSIVFSVPLVVFPCRASLHSLIFRRVNMHHSLHDVSTNYIPEIKLKILTVGIIAFTLVVGILIPNIELVLGLVGSTTGTVICIIFPSIMFIRVTSKQTTERLLAQVLFFTGVVMMVVSTYATLYAVEQAANEPLPDQLRVTEIIKAVKVGEELASGQQLKKDLEGLEKLISPVKFEKFESKNVQKQQSAVLSSSSSKKPPRIREDQGKVIEVGEFKAPVKMKDADNSNLHSPIKQENSPGKNIDQKLAEEVKKLEELKPNENIINKVPETAAAIEEKQKESQPQGPPVQSFKIEEKSPVKSDDFIVVQQQQQQPSDQDSVVKNPPVEGQGSQDQGQVQDVQKSVPVPIQEEKKPVVVVEQKQVKDGDVAAVLLKKLEQHEENQKKFLEEQRQVLAELKEHHAQDVQKQQKEDEVKVQAPQEDTAIKQQESPKSELKQEEDRKSKEEVVKQEQIIEKLSENIEKEAQNVKLIEKLEEGLNKEIETAKKPENLERVQKSLRNAEPVPAAAEKVLLKPIPIQHSEQKSENIVVKKEEKVPLPQEKKVPAPASDVNVNNNVVINPNKIPEQVKQQQIEVSKAPDLANNKQVDRDM